VRCFLRGDCLIAGCPHPSPPPEEEGGRGTCHLPPPEIVGHFLPQLAVVLDHFLRQRQAGGERGVVEGALAKAVDGEDGRLVEVAHGTGQAPGHGLVFETLGTQRGEQAGDERVGRLGAASLQARQHLRDALAHPLAQLRGGGLGEGHHQDLLHLQIALQQQAQVQAADVPGLAGAGRGLDQPHAFKRTAEDVQRHGLPRRHDAASQATSGVRSETIAPKTRPASSSKSPSSGSATPRRASRCAGRSRSPPKSGLPIQACLAL